MNAADAVLKADERHIGHIMLVGKNVCHDIKNAQSGIWNGDEYKEFVTSWMSGVAISDFNVDESTASEIADRA